MKYQKTIGAVLILTLLTGIATAQDSNWEQIKQDEQLNLEQSSSSDTDREVTTSGGYVNGTISLELNITPKSESSSYSAEVIEFEIDESDRMKPGTVRATGSQGDEYKAELLSKNGEVITSHTFRLYSESVENRRYAENGSYAPPLYVKNYYPKHVFNFQNNYSARKIRIEGQNIETMEISIPQRVCTDSEYPHYCDYNNFTETEDGEKIGLYETGKLSISIWDRLIRLVQSFLEAIPLL